VRLASPCALRVYESVAARVLAGVGLTPDGRSDLKDCGESIFAGKHREGMNDIGSMYATDVETRSLESREGRC
jgi:hypothetical protein